MSSEGCLFPSWLRTEQETGLKRLQGKKTKPDMPTGGGYPEVALATEHLIKAEKNEGGTVMRGKEVMKRRSSSPRPCRLRSRHSFAASREIMRFSTNNPQGAVC